MKVLILEHDELLVTTLVFRIRQHGFKVEKAKDGKEALQKLRTTKFDLLVADIFEPEFTGLHLVKAIRKNSKNRKTPVLLIADLDQEEQTLLALKLGVTDFVTKPFKPDELVIRIKGIFQSKKVKVS